MNYFNLFITAIQTVGCIGGLTYLVHFWITEGRKILKTRNRLKPQGVPIDPGYARILYIYLRHREYLIEKEKFKDIADVDECIAKIKNNLNLQK